MTDEQLDALESAAKNALGIEQKSAAGIEISATHLLEYDSYIDDVNPTVVLKLIATLKKTKAERDWLAGILAEHCNKQDPSVYEADGSYCHMCKAKCQFPFSECENVTAKMWLEKASW